MPASYAFPAVRRGDTKTLAVYLLRKGIRSLARSPLLQPGDAVTWTLRSPGGTSEDRAADLDIGAGKASLPLTAEQTAAMTPGTYSGWLRVKETDGVVTTHLTFSLPIVN